MPSGPAPDDAKPRVRRRALLIAATGAVALAAGGKLIAQRLPASTSIDLSADGIVDTLVAFTGDLFGRTFSEFEQTDLTQRVAFLLTQEGPVPGDCRRLAFWLHDQARGHGVSTFRDAPDARRQAIVEEVMRINWHTVPARFLARISSHERGRYRMRWSAVPQLAWIYRHAAPAWRARGYRRWPGVPGDWRESLIAGGPAPA